VAFTATGDDGIRIKVDGAVVLDGWRDQPATRYDATAPVSAGTRTVVVEHYDSGGSAVAMASWQAATAPVTCAAGEFRAEYFINRTLSGAPTTVRCEAAINHDWGAGAPAPGIGADNFSVRWTAQRSFAGGNVAFTATGDDGIRIKVDGAVVLDGWRDQPATRYDATAAVTAGTHTVVVEHYDSGGSAVAQASWR
jgi:predicted RNA-binding Zn ribbon-like protein